MSKLPLSLASDEIVISLRLHSQDGDLIKFIIGITHLASLANTHRTRTGKKSDLCRFQCEVYLPFANSTVASMEGAGISLTLLLNIRKPDVPCIARIETHALSDENFVLHGSTANDDIGHPKLFMVGKASGADFLAAADCE
jgi:hypothetical protein